MFTHSQNDYQQKQNLGESINMSCLSPQQQQTSSSLITPPVSRPNTPAPLQSHPDTVIRNGCVDIVAGAVPGQIINNKPFLKPIPVSSQNQSIVSNNAPIQSSSSEHTFAHSPYNNINYGSSSKYIPQQLVNQRPPFLPRYSPVPTILPNSLSPFNSTFHTGRPPPLQLGPEKHMSFFRLDDFIIVKQLGTGTFGRVYLARYRSVPKYFALKSLRKVDVMRLKQVDHAQNERSLLSRINHPFIIKLYSAMQDHRFLYMLMEYAPGGELFHYLRRSGRLDISAARFYIAELVLAIEYLHSYDIVYRDLKPENLLLDADGHLKLADFGFAKIVPNFTYTLCGTPEYLAPEIILGGGYGRSVDWWALGVLLYEILTGNPPFNGSTPTAVYEKTLQGRIYFPSYLCTAAQDLLSGLLCSDVSRRLGCSERGAQDVKEMPFFAGISWDLVYQRAYRPPILPQMGNSPEDTVNFPLDDCKSSMDEHIENEAALLASQGLQTFAGFTAA